jgi:Mrp family chromosome partitioning ATPase
VLLVIEDGHTKIDELKHAATLLKDSNVLGTVFNKATDNKIQFD